jgi:hypothetical protein
VDAEVSLGWPQRDKMLMPRELNLGPLMALMGLRNNQQTLRLKNARWSRRVHKVRIISLSGTIAIFWPD